MIKNQTFRNVSKVFLVTAMMFASFTLVNLERLEAAPSVGARSEAQMVINVNQASFEELQAIRGVGPSLAERIVAYREENGFFESAEDLSNVRGIGGAKLQKIKAQITL